MNGVLHAAEVEKDDGDWWSKITGVVTGFRSATDFHVNGIRVAADGRTAFTDGTAFLRVGAGVEVEGRVVDGALVATEVEKDDGDELAEITGSISAVRSATDFDVNGLRVDATRAAFPDGTAFLHVGGRAEVEGRVVGGVLQATEVERDDGDEAWITGVVTVFRSATDFDVNGIRVTADGQTRFPDGRTFLRVGAGVEVEGSLVAGTLRATDVGELGFELYGTVSDVNVGARSFTLTSSGGIAVLVVWDERTFLPLTPAGPVDGARVKVEARSDGGRMRAIKLISLQKIPD